MGIVADAEARSGAVARRLQSIQKVGLNAREGRTSGRGTEIRGRGYKPLTDSRKLDRRWYEAEPVEVKVRPEGTTLLGCNSDVVRRYKVDQ